MEDLLFEIKPKFITLVRSQAEFEKKLRLASILPICATSFVSAYCAMNSVIDVKSDKFVFFIILISFITLLIGFLIVAVILNYLDKRNFEVTIYKIYDDRIEFEEGFVNHKHNVVMFKDIKEIHLNQNFIQRKYNIGTIEFVTEATNTNYQQYYLRGIEFTDIENPQEIYNKIKNIHERG